MASSFTNISSYIIPFSSAKKTRFPVKAAAEGKSNLDQLQRTSRQQQQQQLQPKLRVAQVAPPPTTGLWDRFPAARTAQQMVEDPWVYGGTWASSAEKGSSGYSGVRRPWGIKQRELDYLLRFDMPGMTKNDAKLWVEENMLVLKAEKREGEEGSKEEEWPATSFGTYSTRIALPENIELEKIRAEVKDGVLYITIPKAASKIIDINVQ